MSTYSIQRPINRAINRGISKAPADYAPVGGGGPTPPTPPTTVPEIYFEAVESAGGSFAGTYTETFIKAQHTVLYANLVSLGLWDKLLMLELMCGKTFAGAPVKFKGNEAWNRKKGGGEGQIAVTRRRRR